MKIGMAHVLLYSSCLEECLAYNRSSKISVEWIYEWLEAAYPDSLLLLQHLSKYLYFDWWITSRPWNRKFEWPATQINWIISTSSGKSLELKQYWLQKLALVSESFGPWFLSYAFLGAWFTLVTTDLLGHSSTNIFKLPGLHICKLFVIKELKFTWNCE